MSKQAFIKLTPPPPPPPPSRNLLMVYFPFWNSLTIKGAINEPEMFMLRTLHPVKLHE